MGLICLAITLITACTGANTVKPEGEIQTSSTPMPTALMSNTKGVFAITIKKCLSKRK